MKLQKVKRRKKKADVPVGREHDRYLGHSLKGAYIVDDPFPCSSANSRVRLVEEHDPGQSDQRKAEGQLAPVPRTAEWLKRLFSLCP